MKKTILLVGIAMASLSTFAQGYINFSWFGNGSQGVQIGSPSNPASQQPGWYVAGDYSVEAYMAFGTGQAEGSLTPIASTKTVFIGDATSSAAGTPQSNGSGLIQGPITDTGLATGDATIQVRAWYSGSGATSYEAALAQGLNTGKSTLYTINLRAQTDPTVQTLDAIGFNPFTVSASVVPEPSTFALAGLGAAAMLIFRRRK
jgi:hypothetical protein